MHRHCCAVQVRVQLCELLVELLLQGCSVHSWDSSGVFCGLPRRMNLTEFIFYLRAEDVKIMEKVGNTKLWLFWKAF